MAPTKGTIRKKAHLPLVLENVDKAKEAFKNVSSAWEKELDKMIARMEVLDRELLDDGKDDELGELSVTGQIMIEKSIDKLIDNMEEFDRQHKNLHTEVSKIGRIIERHFPWDITGNFRREKNLEERRYQNDACQLIHDMLVTDGNYDLADDFNEKVIPNLNLGAIDEWATIKECRTAMTDVELEDDYFFAMRFIETWLPEKEEFQMEMCKHYVMKQICEGEEFKSIDTLIWFDTKTYHKDVARLCGAILFGKSAISNPRYSDMYDPDGWANSKLLLKELTGRAHTTMAEIFHVGRAMISKLSSLRKTFFKECLDIDEELPVEVYPVKQIHSTFTCPILKEQTTGKNPPMKLQCGHVISKEAMNRLTSTRVVTSRSQMGRQTRLKCPYCPKEQNMEAAKQVYFSHVSDDYWD
ncbi:unnamed protein product [Caenorhabditis bovis]|uniref:RING-Gid-type domain-containing protein n=1 Tax=Caenorhabditis bovis TaxID=2654633 RepID=A0A8S1EIE3_9PELO|nr:unnamed protein product [Caenorhabditis bovis]